MRRSADFEATLVRNSGPAAWTYAIVPDSAQVFGTRGPVKTRGEIDGKPVTVTLLPMGDGTHMLPVRAALRTLIGKSAGDRVHAHLEAWGEG